MDLILAVHVRAVLADRVFLPFRAVLKGSQYEMTFGRAQPFVRAIFTYMEKIRENGTLLFENGALGQGPVCSLAQAYLQELGKPEQRVVYKHM
eukprot:1661563-Prorocentrum_lima.AAC.1